MTELATILQRYVAAGSIPGAVAILARGDDIEVHAVGHMGFEDDRPMARDTIMRIASITKPIVAAAAMLLVEEGVIGLDDPLTEWLPELADPVVVRTAAGPLDDVVPADRPITLRDLLTSRPGWGFPPEFELPAVQALGTVQKDGRRPHTFEPPAEWLRLLGKVPMVAQPGNAFLYATAFDILGVLIARIAGQPLRQFLSARLFEPLGMVDTSFALPTPKRDRLATFYMTEPNGELTPADDAPIWEQLPAFESGGGGLLGTADDWLHFGRMLLAGGQPLLPEAAVRHMLTNQLTSEQSAAASLFLNGQGWGFGGSVDVAATEPGFVPGRYGWVGGTGTCAHIIPSTGTVAILLTQVGMPSPVLTPLQRDFWRCAAAF